VRTTRLLTSAAAVSLLGLLTSCGGLQPGVAASMGDTTISNRDVEQLTTLYCASVEDSLKANSRAVPMSYVRSSVVTSLILRAVADGIGEQYGVTSGTSYAAAVAGAEKQAATFDEDEGAAFVKITTSSDYLQDVVTAAATTSLEQEGVADPTLEQSSDRARELFTTYPVEHDLRIDPTYGLEWSDGNLQPADTGVSFAKSEVATRGLAQEESPAWAFELPSSHRCG